MSAKVELLKLEPETSTRELTWPNMDYKWTVQCAIWKSARDMIVPA